MTKRGHKQAETALAPKIRKLRASGLSTRAIAEEMSANGDGVSHATVHRVVKRDETARREAFQKAVQDEAEDLAEEAVAAHREILRHGVPLLAEIRSRLYYIDKSGKERYSPGAATSWANVANAVQRAAAALAGMSEGGKKIPLYDQRTMILNLYKAYGHEVNEVS